MAAKSEAKGEAPPPAAAAPAAPAPAVRKGAGAWIPAIFAVFAAPAASWAVTQFVLVPSLQKKLTVSVAAADASANPALPGGGAKAGPAAPQTYAFDNVVVNLAGTMGTRYLKTSFIVTGSGDGMRALFDEKKAQLMDVTLNVLSSLTMSDLEEPGSKNVLREKLVTAYNQALGRKVADQVYFSDFVVQ